MKKGICKCGRKYECIGLDLGYCVKCIDAMEEDKPRRGNKHGARLTKNEREKKKRGTFIEVQKFISANNSEVK